METAKVLIFTKFTELELPWMTSQIKPIITTFFITHSNIADP